MGRYFGLFNHTQHHNVSVPWKSETFCNCHDVMHQLKWAPTDSITSACYDESCVFVYDPKYNAMEIEKFDNHIITDETLYKSYGFDQELVQIETTDHVPMEWQ